MRFFSWLTKRAIKLPATSRPGGGETPSQQYLERRDLLRMAFRDTLALTGLPPGWMSMKVSPSARGAGDVDALIVLHHWDLRIAQSAPEVERLLRLRVSTNGVGTDTWRLDLSWRFEVNVGASVPLLPPASQWAELEAEERLAGWLETVAVAQPEDAPAFTESMREDLAILQQARQEDALRHGPANSMRVAF